MSFTGHVQNGVVVFDPPITLPEGIVVEVVIKNDDAPKPAESSLGGLLRFAGSVKDLPADMALNYDAYLHGAPKR